MKTNNSIILLTCILLVGCTAIDQKTAEKNALDFIDSNVKFYTQEAEDKQNVSQYSIERVTTVFEKNQWHVVAHIESLSNESKDNDIMITLDKKGQVVAFNGREVPR